MMFTEPMPFAAAVARLESKTPVASALSSDEWAQLQLGLKDRAFFSAKVNDLRTVATMQQKLDEALTVMSDPDRAFMDRGKFISEMRQSLGATPGDSGEMTDLTSTNRLGLIYDFQIEDAREFGRWQAGQDPAILDEFPAQELIRLWEPKGGPDARRDWAQRWIDAGGQSFHGRMIALKGGEIWTKLSRFERPWPPFDFASGMGLQDIDRDSAEALGLLTAADVMLPQEGDFNAKLAASVPANTSPAILDGFKQIFGEQVDVGRDGKITWQGQRVQKLYDTALADPAVKWSLDLGEATGGTLAQAQAAGADLSGARLSITSDDVRHIVNKHGVGAEQDGSQRPVTSLDLQLIPHVWRAPDAVKAGDKPGTLEFSADLAGRRTLIVFDRLAKTPSWNVRTLWVKKKEGTP